MKNKGYILIGKGKFQLVLKSLPDTLSEHNVLLRVEYCGICGGDHSFYLGRRPEYPKSLGHELVGTILRIGREVQAFHVGDTVVSDLNYRCGECDYCLTERSHLCIKNNIELFSNRAFFQYMTIDESYLYKVKMPESTLYRAALIEPLSCVIHSCAQLDTLDWNTLLINGCGSIGTLACFYLKKLRNNCNIFVYDVNPHRSTAVSELLGVTRLAQLDEERFDGVYECSNSSMGMVASLKSVRRGGALCVLSHLYGEQTSSVYEMICKKELRAVFPLRNGQANNICAAIACMETHWTASLDQLIGVYPFVDLPTVFHNKKQLELNKQVIKMRTD